MKNASTSFRSRVTCMHTARLIESMSPAGWLLYLESWPASQGLVTGYSQAGVASIPGFGTKYLEETDLRGTGIKEANNPFNVTLLFERRKKDRPASSSSLLSRTCRRLLLLLYYRRKLLHTPHACVMAPPVFVKKLFLALVYNYTHLSTSRY